ncbi:hypothetical protein DACRYDRAFT_111902 [Dacryopinax primogenitus]|uniref:GATA-type domain-containing protein n=1 Tax=Dacryopinax primogenitus (strain DJM 731) TaxID=1858805 RepID=M5FPW6_DACPD|nr:uncharacterized protein DACRYDRAFT_111902 [Dacryopinax primogenitus]EJT97363.1 hypothetical protein DACRYDRAFT_111902 [Dacryopinax primogenitus]
MSTSGIVKREPEQSPERMLFSPEPAHPRTNPSGREAPAGRPLETFGRNQPPTWRVQPMPVAPPSGSGSGSGTRSWLHTVQNDPEGMDRYSESNSPPATSGGVFPSYGAPNTPMRPNQRHAPGYTCPDCETTHTAAWRWYEGRKYCNACGLHRKANGKKRSERLIEQDKQRRQDKQRAEQEFLHRIEGVKREGTQ